MWILLLPMFVILCLFALISGFEKILYISVISFISMSIPLWFSGFKKTPKRLVWIYGLSSGAMIISSMLFLVPIAVKLSTQLGSLGIGLGVLIGYGTHTISHNESHKLELSNKKELASLTLHTIFAGFTIGIIYSQIPSVSILLGLSIVSHKLPASIVTVEKISKENKKILIPASLFGIFCILSFAFIPTLPNNITSIIFGVGAGIFIHMAMDFLPECESGDIYEVVSETDYEHEMKDKLRYNALASVTIGSLIIVLLWYII